jgi:hypothetical protein
LVRLDEIVTTAIFQSAISTRGSGAQDADIGTLYLGAPIRDTQQRKASSPLNSHGAES